MAALALACGLAGPFVLAQGDHYAVAPGDTLTALAERFDTSVARLRELNDLSGDHLEVGQRLRLPARGYRREAVAGDASWDALAERWGLSRATLRSANPAYERPPAAVWVPPGEGTTVRARPGDDVVSLATRHGVGPAALTEANGWRLPVEVGAGVRVLVPGVPREAAAPRTGGPSAAPPVDASARARHRERQAIALGRLAPLLRGTRPPPEGYRWPLNGRVSSRFGLRNVSVGGNRHHGGIDLAADAGTPVRAARRGRVVRAGWVGAYGYAVYLDHADGAQTRYAHLSRIDVARGAWVPAGAVLGRVGSSGASTGPHLHFEIRLQGRAVDPLGVLPPPSLGGAVR